MEHIRYGREIFEELRALDLPVADFAVFGSGPLLARGIIDDVADLDVLCRGAVVTRAEQLSTSETTEHGVRVLSRGAISFGTTWGIGSFDVDEIITNAEMIDGLPFARLDYVIAYKQIAQRPKDLEHLELLDEWLRRA